MAEAIVCFVIDKLISLLLTAEAKLARDARSEVGFIRDEIESIRSFFKDADAKAATRDDEMANDSIKTWVKQVREAAYCIEDIKMRTKDDIVSKIDGMKTLVSEIKARSERYGFNSIDFGEKSLPRHDPRVASLFIEEAEVVGVESARDELISWLVNEASRRKVISVVGMGGLGKTTLAKKSYKVEDLLRRMIMQFYKASDTMDEEALIRKLREYLERKRYVVVFDDVWKVDFWGAIEHALPDNKGRRIMITSRNKDVADFCIRSCFVHVHPLKLLPPNKAWELFCKKAFQFELEGNCPPHLEELSLNIVKKCEGLPMAIVSIGGLLSTQVKGLYEWQRLYNSLSSELESNPHLKSLTRILYLSYHHLPYYLKSCVLYFGIFPEDYSVSCIRLIRLWIAEGFVKLKKGKTLEEVGEEYLTELIHRNLVQVSKVYIDGKARSCRLHDLLREVLRRKGADSSFCHMLSEDESTFEPVTRRLSIDSSPSEALGSITQSHIRSIFTFNQVEWLVSFLNTLSGNLKLVKVLDFTDAPLNYLPKFVGYLYLLKYLSLRNTKGKLLPESICNLQNLETLDLKQSLVYEIPAEIKRLVKLRHLLGYYHDYNIEFSLKSERGVKIDDGIGCLQALQKLYNVEANHGGINLIKAPRKLRQLRKLGLKSLKSEDGRALLRFELSTISEDEVLGLQSISSPPEFIRILYLKGRLEKLPSWIPKLQHLVKLKIFWSRLRDSPLKALQNLPYRLELGLSYKVYDGVELHFERGFQKLEVLQLRDLDGLNSLVIDNEAMPLLRELEIGPSTQLKEMPSSIHHLRNLTTLHFVNMLNEFQRDVDPKNGQHYWVVKHIRDVLFSYKFGTRCGIYETHNLCVYPNY
ncbi:unnamed protein product [Malus baccata var. baccata]